MIDDRRAFFQQFAGAVQFKQLWILPNLLLLFAPKNHPKSKKKNHPKNTPPQLDHSPLSGDEIYCNGPRMTENPIEIPDGNPSFLPG